MCSICSKPSQWYWMNWFYISLTWYFQFTCAKWHPSEVTAQTGCSSKGMEPLLFVLARLSAITIKGTGMGEGRGGCPFKSEKTWQQQRNSEGSSPTTNHHLQELVIAIFSRRWLWLLLHVLPLCLLLLIWMNLMWKRCSLPWQIVFLDKMLVMYLVISMQYLDVIKLAKRYLLVLMAQDYYIAGPGRAMQIM